MTPRVRPEPVPHPTSPAAAADAASFRDPSGVVFRRDGVLYRQINAVFEAEWAAFRSSGLADRLLRDGLLVPHEEVDRALALDDRACAVIRPQLVDFISYPYEWSFSALKDAALTTLAIQERALDARMTLKDASAYNIQFVDGRPVLIDSLSFERVEPGTPWVAYRQFCQHFLAPLALMAYRDVRCGLLLRDFIDGVPLDMAVHLLPGRTRLRLGLAAHVHAHAGAQRRATDETAPAKARTVRVSETGQRALLDSLRRTIGKLRWKAEGTAWAGYTTRTSYTAEAAEAKARIVGEMLGRTAGGRVWDLGANDGAFSAIAAKAGKRVVAIDGDPVAIERLYLAGKRGDVHGILPLVVDLANPSPAIGWAHAERSSLLGRGPAPVVLALALVHHLAIGNNVPLPVLASFFAAAGDELVVEFVPKDDPQTQTLLASRRDVFADYSLEGFRAAFGREFLVVEETAIPDSRRVLFRLCRQAG